ncbi:hypothetical protein FQN60_012507 [Etheostoma spectabile]|uniref:Uncharacterized protein n=1 Tax=Etheostoma spectabile TaxID=54343 RepID=A0A5J5DQ25_9PERO|nr:hypothetical protein FQN60_012507 [Etheostoma spectabile]
MRQDFLVAGKWTAEEISSFLLGPMGTVWADFDSTDQVQPEHICFTDTSGKTIKISSVEGMEEATHFLSGA